MGVTVELGGNCIIVSPDNLIEKVGLRATQIVRVRIREEKTVIPDRKLRPHRQATCEQ